MVLEDLEQHYRFDLRKAYLLADLDQTAIILRGVVQVAWPPLTRSWLAKRDASSSLTLKLRH